MKKIAVIGDIHGCIDEFTALLSSLEHHSLDEIWHLGDLVDRGPDSGAVVEICRKKGVRGVKGNHESTILAYRKQPKPEYAERFRTFQSIRSEHDWSYLESLPDLHVDDDLNVVLVHGGLWPKLPLWKQPKAAIYAQMILPWNPGKTEWWGQDDEDELRQHGYVRWYEAYDGTPLVIYGHSVFPSPFRYKNTIGIDTGGVFGGSLTAILLPKQEYVTIKAKNTYFNKHRV